MQLKSMKLIAMRPDNLIEARFALTAKQNDIIDMVLSQIKDDDCYRYELDIERFKNFYKTDTSNIYRDLKKAVEGFEKIGLEILNTEINERVYFPWFSKIHYKNNEGVILVNLDLDFKKILLEVKKKIFYDITIPLNFTSMYSKRLYYYLKSFEDTGWRIDNIDELRSKLECPKSYDNYSDFKRYVLNPAYGEINNNSDILFNYQTIKEGRKIAKIKFLINSKKNLNINKEKPLLLDENSDTFDNTEIKNSEDNENADNPIDLIRTITEGKLSEASMETLYKVAEGNIEVIKEKYLLAIKNGSVEDLGKWLYRAIQKDYKEEKGLANRKNKKPGFNNFKSRLDEDPDYANKIKKALKEKYKIPGDI